MRGGADIEDRRSGRRSQRTWAAPARPSCDNRAVRSVCRVCREALDDSGFSSLPVIVGVDVIVMWNLGGLVLPATGLERGPLTYPVLGCLFGVAGLHLVAVLRRVPALPVSIAALSVLGLAHAGRLVWVSHPASATQTCLAIAGLAISSAIALWAGLRAADAVAWARRSRVSGRR